MTLEEAVEWCQQHQATVNFRYLARTYGDEWQGYGGKGPQVTVMVDKLAGRANLAVTEPTLVEAVEKAAAAEKALAQ